MGGRIAEQVRRALIAAAKMTTVVVVVDAAGIGCGNSCLVHIHPVPDAGPDATVHDASKDGG
jgi:hypothetical protein